MPYVKCAFCGHGGIQNLDIGVCTNCLQRGNETIIIYAIKKYIEKNPGATTRDIRRNLKIDQQIINKLIEEGSIELIYTQNTEKAIDTSRSKKVENLRRQLSDMGNYNRDRLGKLNNIPSQLVEDLKNRKNRNDDRTR